MIPQYRPIYTPVHVHLVCGSILFPSSGGNSLVAKLSSGEPGVVGSSPGVSTSPLTGYEPICHPPFRTNLLQDKRFRGGDRVQIHNHESHSWFGPPFASCEVMRSHYGPLGRTRGANPPDLSSIPGPCTSLHFFFLSFGVFGMGTQTGAHPPGPPFESRASKFSFFLSFF